MRECAGSKTIHRNILLSTLYSLGVKSAEPKNTNEELDRMLSMIMIAHFKTIIPSVLGVQGEKKTEE